MKLERVIQVCIILACVGVCIAIFATPAAKSTTKGLFVIAVGSAFALCWLTAYVFDRKRRSELAAALQGRGLIVGQASEAVFIHQPRRGERGHRGKFWASAPDGSLHITEFTYLTGSGKHVRTHRNTQVSRPAPGRWPDLRLTRRKSFLERSITNLTGADDYGLENPAFGKRWSLECEYREFGVMLLSPIVQDWLMLAPKDESWTIASGRVCLTRSHVCDSEEVSELIARLDEFLAMVPPELVAYERAAPGT